MPPRKRAAPPEGPTLTLLPKLLDAHREAPDLRDVIHSLKAEFEVESRDRALIALALRYAAEIEDAAELTADVERMLEKAAEAGDHYLSLEVKRLRRRIELAETVAKIGPHLNKALADLMATPASRSKGAGAKPKAAGRLQQLQGGIA